jgi:DNA-binding SARP family transcriptional activator
LDEALGGLAGRQRLRAVLLTFKAEILIAIGRATEAIGPDEEARSIGVALGDRRVLGYVAWNEARAASQAGDAALTLDRLAEVERHPGDWFEHFTGTELLADAAVLADRVGETEASARYLARARARRTETEQAVLIAEAVVAARSGDPAEAEAGFRALETTERLETRDRWWLTLMRAWAAGRAGDPGARPLAEEAFRMAAAIDPALPFVREPKVSAALRDWLGAPDPDPALGVTLRLLGPTVLQRGAREVPVPPGRPAALLEMLGLAGEVPVEEVLERLWPEIDPDTGRARLRNTLNRLRDACGPVVIRHGEALRLAPEVSVDARRFESDARAALDALRAAERAAGPGSSGTPGPRALEAARAVTGRLTGTLLPGRPYDEWATEARERLLRLQLGLTDRLQAVAETQGDLDDAIRLARSAIALDPDDEARYLVLARLLLRQGRRGPALAALQAGVRALAELGLPPGRDLAAAIETIGR